jgi:2-iminobutanoate/2-iminopropanoate deaminase
MREAGVTVQAPAPIGPYSQSVRIGRIVHAAGQGADDPATGTLAGTDIVAQTRQCLRNLEAVLAASGATLDDVLRVGVFLAERSDFEGMNAVYRTFFRDRRDRRARRPVGVTPAARLAGLSC